MAETKREIERKYEADDGTVLPDLTRAAGVAAVTDEGVTELDAVYYDTADLRLAAASLTLRRRTGGADAGWHLKFPVATGIRDEIRAPLSETLPGSLAGLVRSLVRDEPVRPVVRLRSRRDVRLLTGKDGGPLAELSVDTVHAQRLTGPGEAAWTEIEVELADGADPAVLDAVGRRLEKAGIRPSAASSKLARALAETGATVPDGPDRVDGTPAPGTAGHAVLAYVRAQRDALVALDPAVRRELPDSVHRMRIACRRLRGALRTYGTVLDRRRTDPLGAELRWLAGELGAARDEEVLGTRLAGRLDALPGSLRIGPVHARLRRRGAGRADEARRAALAALDSARHLALLDALDALLADPPLRPAAAREAGRVLARAARADLDRADRRFGHALALGPGPARDLALHEARKAAKRARYAGEAARPVLGGPAKRLAARMKAVQTLLGEHQDGVVARTALRELAAQAHAAGESAFTWGLLYGREEAEAAAQERELPALREWAAAPALRASLGR
ncbi:CYTH and CHAD domain-containing protein [Streptomyces sp. NPDC048659]|uniref:CYTH and CHAD domain-containing protein n=1 Tax=Streptomyces sp. NPDC048659 TaxID=3155489 RepID=UPI0034470353